MTETGPNGGAADVPPSRNMDLAGEVPDLPNDAAKWLFEARTEVMRFQMEAGRYVSLNLLHALHRDWSVIVSDLESGDHVKIAAACRELARLGDAALEPLYDVVKKSRDERARRVALENLRKLISAKDLESKLTDDAIGTQTPEFKANLLIALKEFASTQTATRIEGLVQHVDKAVRRAAYDLLAGIGPGVFTEGVFQALESDVEEVKADAAAAVGVFKLTAGVKPLLSYIAPVSLLTAERYEAMQAIVCEALGEVGDPRAVGPLISALSKHGVGARTKRPEVRAAAAAALVKLADREHRDKILSALEKASHDSNLMVAEAARRAVRYLKGGPAGAPLSATSLDQEEGDF